MTESVDVNMMTEAELEKQQQEQDQAEQQARETATTAETQVDEFLADDHTPATPPTDTPTAEPPPKEMLPEEEPTETSEPTSDQEKPRSQFKSEVEYGLYRDLRKERQTRKEEQLQHRHAIESIRQEVAGIRSSPSDPDGQRQAPPPDVEDPDQAEKWKGVEYMSFPQTQEYLREIRAFEAQESRKDDERQQAAMVEHQNAFIQATATAGTQLHDDYETVKAAGREKLSDEDRQQIHQCDNPIRAASLIYKLCQKAAGNGSAQSPATPATPNAADIIDNATRNLAPGQRLPAGMDQLAVADALERRIATCNSQAEVDAILAKLEKMRQ